MSTNLDSNYNGGIPEIEVSTPSSPPKAQKRKPEVSGTPKPGSGPGCIIRALASIYQVSTVNPRYMNT